MVRTENEDGMRAYCLNCGEIFVFDVIGVPEGLPLSNPMFCIPCFEFVGDFPTETLKLTRNGVKIEKTAPEVLHLLSLGVKIGEIKNGG